jgi:hypothetical protein
MSEDTRIDTADILAIDAAVARSTGAPQFGITKEGFVAKPFARLLAEKLALAREFFGDELDLSSGSAIRKLLEVSALEDARTWAALSAMYDNNFVVSATGDALSRLGEELGVHRPHLEARGKIRLRLQAALPSEQPQLTIPLGARLLTPGGHHVATDETVVLSADNPERQLAVVAFYPGPDHNLDPGVAVDGSFPQRIDRWNYLDSKLATLQTIEEQLLAAEALSPDQSLVSIEHTEKLEGGEQQWPDARYRELLLRAPRSLWTVEIIQFAVSLVPGVRQVQVFDDWGGLDISTSIFGDFYFGKRVFRAERQFDLIERVFRAESSLGHPYDFTILVAPTSAAIWEGPDGIRASIESAIEDLRPISIFPQIRRADEVYVGVAADLVVKGLLLPTGSPAVVNNSPPAIALKARLCSRVRSYVESLEFGEPVRWSEVMRTLMNEPGIADVNELGLLRYPPSLRAVDFESIPDPTEVETFTCDENIEIKKSQIAVFVDDDSRLIIV